jgi:hypothetical protein
MSRPRRGPLYDIIPNQGWIQAFRVIYHGTHSILWKYLMLGPGSNNAGLMVNAAQMYGNTQTMVKTVQVVEL